MKKTVCLNMIVKNEKQVIAKCLHSIKSLIDYWVIVDTGSSDDTQTIIQDCLKTIPGELHEQRWIDFAYNRNAAMKLAQGKADYLFFIDADEYLEYPENFDWPRLDKDAFYFLTRLPHNVLFYRMLLVNNHLKWVWEGVLHETLYSTEYGRSCAVMDHVVNVAESNDGHRSQDPQKYQKDALLLEKEHAKNPGNSRTIFFLAQSYFQAGEYALSLKNYQKRTLLKGFEEEIYLSFYMSGYLQEKLKMAPSLFIDNYHKAISMRPMRAEPFYRLASYYYSIENYQLTFDLVEKALCFPMPTDGFNVEKNIYDFGLSQLRSECAAHLNGDLKNETIALNMKYKQEERQDQNFGLKKPE